MEASDEENSKCQSQQAWIVQEAADHRRPAFQTLGTGRLERFTFSVIEDLEDKMTFLHVSHVEPRGSRKETFLLVLGFSEDRSLIAFDEIVRKIEDYTNLETNPHEKIETDR
jgi:hypothetical protein